MTNCMPIVTDLGRAERVHISWPVAGLGSSDVVHALLDDGSAVALTTATDLLTVTGYFAGPEYVSPSPAAVIAATTYVTIRIVTTTETLRFDGGFIRLTP